MKHKKVLFMLLSMSYAGLVVAGGGTLKITNKLVPSNAITGYVRVYVGCRDDSETDNYIAALGINGSFSSLEKARNGSSTLIEPGDVVSLPYGHGPRGIFVDFLDGNAAIASTISFPFGEVNSEIYILGGADTQLGDVKVSVAYWNLDAVKAKFPNGLVGDANGNLTADQLALLTPASTDAKAWNYNARDHVGLMVTMYDQNLSPKITK